MSRRRAVFGVAGVLLLLLLRAASPAGLRRRAEFIVHLAPLDLNVRRLNGAAAAFDRQFYVFLESARHKLPPGTAGVALVGAPASNPVVYLATYHLAPIPVLVAPARVPPGWVLAVYGPGRPPGWKVIARVWKGALMEPAS